MSNGIVRLGRVAATKNGNLISARYYVGATPTAINNGMLVIEDGLIDADTDRDLFKVVYPSAITNKGVGVVTTPEIVYSEATKQNLADFTNAASANIRITNLQEGDELSVTEDCLNMLATVPVVGNYVILKASSTLWDEVESLGGTELFYGKIIAKELFNTTRTTYMYVIKILSV